MPAASSTTVTGRGRPVSQQLAPSEQIISPQEGIARDELKRKSTRHQAPPVKVLPEYQQPEVSPTEQYRPDVPSLRTPEPKQINNEFTDSPVARHRPLPRQEVSTLPRTGDKEPLITGSMTKKPEPQGEAPSGGHVKNGDLPHDQLIPLDELPGEPGEEPVVPVVSSQPVFRRPKRRQSVPSKNEAYNSAAARCIGIILIIIGVLEIIANIIGIVFQVARDPQELNIVFYLAPGFWCSIFFILCGAFGIVSAARRTTWTIVTHLVTGTLGAVFACILLAMCGWALFIEIDSDFQLASLILLCLMTFGGLLALPLTIVASVICCQAFCKRVAAAERTESTQDVATSPS